MRMLVATVAAIVCQGSMALAGAQVGFTELDIVAPHQGSTFAGAVWYPAGQGGTLTNLGDNPVFVGAPVFQEAAVAPGYYPVVLVSHNSGGQYQSLGWLAKGLSEHGAIVVAVNHPGSTFGDLDARRSLALGTRVKDLQAAFDQVIVDPRFSQHVDVSRIYATGFSLGGWTAMAIGGARGNPRAYAQHCKMVGARSGHCLEISRAGIDLEALDPIPLRQSYKDARVRAVAAIEPELHYGLTPKDVAELADVTLIGLGTGADRLLAADFGTSGSGLVNLLPSATVKTIAPASHFTAVLECKPAGEALLAEDGDDPVCTDPPGTDRTAVHAEIIATIVKAFELN